MGVANTLKKMIDLAGKFLANGAHAQQDIPSQHRLLNAGGMFAGWFMLDKLRDVMFAVDQKSEGEFVEIKREDVPAPLRFLHKAIDWDPYSDAPEHQWKRLLHQVTPAIGGALGAIAGSMYAFERNGRAQEFKRLSELKGLQKLNLMDAEYVAQYAQSFPLRALAGVFATFSAASGLTFMYGLFLNSAFASSNGAKIFAGDLAKGNMGPVKALDSLLGNIGMYAKDAAKHHTEMSDAWAKQFVSTVLEPFFGHELQTKAAQEKAVKTLQGMVQEAYVKYEQSGLKPEEVAKKVQADMAQLLDKTHIDATLKTKFNLDSNHATLGNANPLIRKVFGDHQDNLIRKEVGYAAAALPVAGIGISALGDLQKKRLTGEQVLASREVEDNGHTHPRSFGKDPKAYVEEALTMQKTREHGLAPTPLMKWIGDAELAVLPKNRLMSAIGLTTGLMVAGNMAKIATGYGLDGKAAEFNKVPTYLQGMFKVVKDYNPAGLRPRDKWIKYAQYAAYSMGGLLGVKIGSDIAFSNVPKKLENPKYLEDFLPRVSMHQGESWGWLSAISGIFGSAAGTFMVPLPGVNYAEGLAGRTTSMQDRNIMLPMESISGATMPSYLRLREGLNYLCHHAVGNKEKDPVGHYEALAYTLLGPIFREKLTAEHIEKFVDAVHNVRDKFMEEGGIPKHKKKEALAAMKAQFTGEGLEVLLINMGLNPAEIVFDKLNGMVGKIGNTLGAETSILKEQKAYHEALLGRLDTYEKQGKIEQGSAQAIRESINDTTLVQKTEAAPAVEPTPGFVEKVTRLKPQAALPEPMQEGFAKHMRDRKELSAEAPLSIAT